MSKRENRYKTIGFVTNGLNGQPVMCKFTALSGGSVNSKTGDMVQSFMLPVQWMDERRIDDDTAVCGDCPHSFRAGDTCYLHKGTAFMGLISTSKAWPQAQVSPEWVVDMAATYFTDKAVRFGSFGEPVLMGEAVVKAICAVARTWTGYTHQWRKPQYQWAKAYFMASVESEELMHLAHSMGWRTFRVRPASDPVLKGETSCPASAEMGKRTTCERCSLCKGAASKAKNITIIEH